MGNNWSMLWMSTAMGNRSLCEMAWDRINSVVCRIKNIYDAFDSETKLQRIVNGNKNTNSKLFADFVLRLLRTEKSVKCYILWRPSGSSLDVYFCHYHCVVVRFKIIVQVTE